MAVIASFEDACEIFSKDVLEALDSITNADAMPRLVDMIWPQEKADQVQEFLTSRALECKTTIRRASYMMAVSMLPEEDAVTILMHLEAHLVPLLGTKATALSNVVWSLQPLAKHLRQDPEADEVLDFCCDDVWTFLEFSFYPERLPDMMDHFGDLEPHGLLSTMSELF